VTAKELQLQIISSLLLAESYDHSKRIMLFLINCNQHDYSDYNHY